MGLGGKLFNAFFAKEASGNILRGHETELQLLRDRLEQISLRSREQALQRQRDEGLMARQISQNEASASRNQATIGANQFSSRLNRIGLADRAEAARDSNLQVRAAEAGIVDAGQLERDELLGGLAQATNSALTAKTTEEAADRLLDVQKFAVDIRTKWPGVEVDPHELLSDPLAFDKLSDRISASEAEKVATENRVPISGVIASVKNMPPELAARTVEALIATGRYLPREEDAMLVAVAMVEADLQVNGVEGARGAINGYIASTVLRLSPPGTGGNSITQLFAENKAVVAEIKKVIDLQVLPDSELDRQLKERYGGNGVAEVFPGGFPGFGAQQMQEVGIRLREEETDAAIAANPQSFPVENALDAEVRQEALLKSLTQLLGNQERFPDPTMGFEAILETLQQDMGHIKSGNRNLTRIPIEYTLPDVLVVFEQIKEMFTLHQEQQEKIQAMQQQAQAQGQPPQPGGSN